MTVSDRTGMSLHIGVNVLNPKKYPCEPPHADFPNGWTGELESCEADAEALQEMATNCGFDAEILKTKKATSTEVTKEIRRAAKKLNAGDIFMLTYAGHGGQVPDRSKDERTESRRKDTLDETWCLYDRQFLDDEVYALFSEFDAGVRILVILDCCHSGTAVRGEKPGRAPSTCGRRIKTRQMPPKSVMPIYLGRKKDYDRLQKETKQVKPGDVKASIRLLAACQDKQQANCDEEAGFFTYSLLRVWDDGNFEGKTYKEFFDAVVEELDHLTGDTATRAAGGADAEESKLQTPNHHREGARDAAFDRQRPFTI